MKQIVEVRDVKIGEGMPKICIPLVGSNNEELIEELKLLQSLKVDIVEWRMDHHEKADDVGQMKETLNIIRSHLGNVPLLATFRTKKEGGEREITAQYYVALNQAMAATGKIDLIDVELFTREEAVRDILDAAHSHHVKVIMSSHDFQKTPSKEEIINRLRRMQELGADIPKIAVMPRSVEDVLTLLSATNEMSQIYATGPIITMSMSGLGVISRLAGEIFGSALTFGSAKMASAPGQVPVEKLAEALNIIHENV